MPKHIKHLLLLMLMFAIAAGIAAYLLTPDSFYRYGHYRADNVTEIAAEALKFQGPAYCQECHEERHAEWSATPHTAVKCEVCHGAVGEHPIEGDLPVVPTDTVKLCTLCHEAMPSRPASQPQIVVSEHAGAEQCVTCHNPHAPRIGGPPGEQAVGGPKSAALCTGCHGVSGLGVDDFPPIAGKDAGYLATQLQDYRSGAREDPMMNAISESLSDAVITELADHYASLKGGTGN